MHSAPTSTPLATSSPLSVDARNNLVHDVLDALSDKAPAERVSLIEGVIAAFADPSPRSSDFLLDKARRSFWEACLALAHLEAGDDDLPAAMKAPGRKSSRAEMLHHFERRAWSAATILPIRSASDLLPAPLHLARDLIPKPRPASKH